MQKKYFPAGSAALTVMAILASPVAAQDAPATDTAKPTGLWERDTLTGDWGGARSQLIDSGVTLGLTEISEVLGNVSGGQRTGFDYMGRTEADIDLDLEKLLGWKDGLVHVSGYQIHGRGLGQNNLGNNLLGSSNIEARRTTRLFDAYLQQGLLDNQLSIRAGQIAADDEFITSQYAATFINSTFGWPGIAAADLTSGGPAYPLATPGLRVKYTPTDSPLYWQTAVFNGDPAGAPNASKTPQQRNPAGTTFSTDQNAFVISELGYAVAADADKGTGPSAYKLGGWYHSGKFNDQRYDVNNQPIATTGNTARQDSGDWGLYGVVDQWLLTKPGAKGLGLAGFLRAGFAPQSDRNPVTAYVDGGFNYVGPFEGRDSDIAGIAFSYAKMGGSAVDFGQDYNAANPGATRPVHDYEAAVEVTYQYAMAPWWTIQPDAQYIFHPGGNAASPSASATSSAGAMKDAFVIGARTTIKF